MKQVVVAAVLLAAAPASAGELRKGEIVVEHPRMRASLGRAPNTAAYLTLRNTGRAPDRLLGASCTCAGRVEIHHHDMSGGVMRMRPVRGLTVPAQDRVTLVPGHGHALMVMGLKAPVRAGTTVEMRLRFERAGEVRAPFLVTRGVDREADMQGRGASAGRAR